MAIAGKSNYLETAILNHVLRNTAYTSPTSVYVSLHTADPDEDGSGAEVAGGGYARQVATFNAPSGGQVANSADINFTNMPAATVSHIGIWDAASNGNLLYGAALSGGSEVVGAGNTFTIPSGQLTVAEG